VDLVRVVAVESVLGRSKRSQVRAMNGVQVAPATVVGPDRAAVDLVKVAAVDTVLARSNSKLVQVMDEVRVVLVTAAGPDKAAVDPARVTEGVMVLGRPGMGTVRVKAMGLEAPVMVVALVTVADRDQVRDPGGRVTGQVAPVSAVIMVRVVDRVPVPARWVLGMGRENQVMEDPIN
jgi:hypothetical protein